MDDLTQPARDDFILLCERVSRAKTEIGYAQTRAKELKADLDSECQHIRDLYDRIQADAKLIFNLFSDDFSNGFSYQHTPNDT